MFVASFAQGFYNIVFFFIFFNKLIYISIGYFIDNFYEIADAMSVYRVAKFQFSFYLIAFGDGYVTHVIAKTDKLCTLPVVPCSSSTHPYPYIVQHFFMLPVSYNNFSFQPHPRHDKTKLPVAMCRLVKVHEIHIYLSPGNITVELRMKM